MRSIVTNGVPQWLCGLVAIGVAYLIGENALLQAGLPKSAELLGFRDAIYFLLVYFVGRSMSSASASNWFAMWRRRSARCGSIAAMRRSWAAAIRSNAAACRKVRRTSGSAITLGNLAQRQEDRPPTYVGEPSCFLLTVALIRQVQNSPPRRG